MTGIESRSCVSPRHTQARIHKSGSPLAAMQGIQFAFSENERVKISAAAFTALPGGYRNNNGTFNNIGNNGNWWSSTENSATNAWNRNLNYNNAEVNRNNNNKNNGFSVRCVRDLCSCLLQACLLSGRLVFY